MKTVLFSFLTATLLGFVSHTSGQAFNAVEFVPVLFATGLLTWTVKQYERRSPSSAGAQLPLHSPVRSEVSQLHSYRLAA